MALMAGLTVISGTYIVYPWYRAKPPAAMTDLSQFPRSYLLANPDLAEWHKFGMEWKGHVAWFAPTPAVTYVVVRYGPGGRERRVLIARVEVTDFTALLPARQEAGYPVLAATF